MAKIKSFIERITIARRDQDKVSKQLIKITEQRAEAEKRINARFQPRIDRLMEKHYAGNRTMILLQQECPHKTKKHLTGEERRWKDWVCLDCGHEQGSAYAESFIE